MKTESFDLQETVTDNKFRGLWRMMHGFRATYLIAIICVGLAALAQAGIYYLLRYFVDEMLLDNRLMRYLFALAIGIITMALVQGALTFLSGRLAALTAEGITRRLRNYVYDHLQRLTYTYHDNMQTGELLQRSTSDVDAIRRMFAEQAIGIGRITLLFIVNFTALLTLNVRLALYSIIVIPFILLISMFFFRKVGEAFERNQEQEAILSNRLQENLMGVRVVKAFARQAYETDKFEIENMEKFRRGRGLTVMHASFWPTTDLVCGGQMLAGFLIGAIMAIEGTITTGTFVAYQGLVVQIIWPIRNLGRLIADVSTGIVSFTRVQEIIAVMREPLDEGNYLPEATDVKGQITFENVTFAYTGTDDVLHNISFTVEAGQTIALLGSTGSGKTTLVNLLPRFYEYTEGSIKLDNVELKQYPRGFLREQIGIVQQEPFLFSRTIRENIAFGVGHDVSNEDVVAAARAADIHESILAFPNGYDTLVGERGVTLSGGQKQRLTLARTLLKNPRILIMDDATSAVDTETESSIRDALRQMMGKRTTFIIAHRIQSVMEADLILVLDEGRIIQRGTHNALMQEQNSTYRQIYELQARVEAELEEEIAQADQSTWANERI